MEKLINVIIEERTKIGDFDTVLKVMWVEAANMGEIDGVDALCRVIQETC